MNKNRRKKKEKRIEYELAWNGLTAAFDSRTKVDIVYDSGTRGAHCTIMHLRSDSDTSDAHQIPNPFSYFAFFTFGAFEWLCVSCVSCVCVHRDRHEKLSQHTIMHVIITITCVLWIRHCIKFNNCLSYFPTFKFILVDGMFCLLN